MNGSEQDKSQKEELKNRPNVALISLHNADRFRATDFLNAVNLNYEDLQDLPGRVY